MSPSLSWPLSFAVGAVLGMLYFRCLWLTVQRLATSGHPVRLLLTSFLCRVAAVLALFYALMADNGWERTVFALAGFIAAREVAKYLWGNKQRSLSWKS